MNIVCGLSVVVGNYQWLLSWLCYISVELQVCCTDFRQPGGGVRLVMQSGDWEYQPEVPGVQSDATLWCCEAVLRGAVLPCRGGGALWNSALCCCVKSGATLWCCKAVIGELVH